jgi:predicted alpha/beta superfamily hydrolase
MINPCHRWLVVILLGLGLADAAIATDAPMPPHASFTIESIALKEARRVNVYKPPGYDASATARYPVLYMPDGGLQEDFPHVIVDIDAAIREGQVRPMIVIGIENTERRRDMTGATTVASDRKIAPHVGGSAAFRSFIADELMPQVRRRCRTDGQTAIIGESLAGLFVVETFLERPELFDTWIALSPSLWWNNQSLARGASARLKAWPNINRTLYLSSASDDDIGNAMKPLRAALRSTQPQGLTWYDEPRPGLHHSDIYRRSSPDIFRKLFPPVVR